MEAIAEDTRLDDDKLATIDFFLSWEKYGIRHTDGFHAPRVNFWRDLLPGDLKNRLDGAGTGDRVEAAFQAGVLMPEWKRRLIHRVRHRDIEAVFPNGRIFEPRLGRFYPRGILNGVAGVFRENIDPFRCIGIDGEGISADFNHPLSGLGCRLSAHVLEVRDKFEEHGGTAIDWFETVTSGPGMQARSEGGATDFFPLDAFRRSDESEDSRFYESPRIVQHIDDTAIDLVKNIYRRLLPENSRVLDLMASWTSHLPDDFPLKWVVGLGMNRAELSANSRLAGFTVHDLNADPRLPYGDSEMDTVICSLSVEYLTRPLEVFAEVRRVLRRGGMFAVTFSDRWFPPKAIRLWSELHSFERMGFVLELFLQTGGFEGLETFSMQGYPRPAHDKYADQRLACDPVFAVWGTKS